jgi:hypothetical protein
MSVLRQADMAPFLRLSDIPELLHMVCRLLEKHDHAVLLRVCRQMYQRLIPLVWEAVDDVIVLAKLIPGVKVLKTTGTLKVCEFN